MVNSSNGLDVNSQLAELLRRQRDRIVTRFVAEVQRLSLPPAETSRVLLVDHIPQFLDEVVEELNRLDPVQMQQETGETSETARQHGEQRWLLGYDLEALIHEYGVLRHVIIDVAKAEGTKPSLDEFNILSKCLSIGVAEAATEYVKEHDAQLNEKREKLKFLVEAGQILSATLDYRATLKRLTALLVPRFADWCAIHLEPEAPEDVVVAHVDPSKAELARDVSRRLVSYQSSREAVAPRSDAVRAQFVPKDVAQSAGASEQTITAPLCVQGHVFGALVLAYSDSQRSYSEDDLVLATELASRAAIALDNARLYAMSQEERSRVEAAGRTKDQLLATVSHELRTPLQAILGWTRLLRAGSLDDGKKAHALEVIERNAQSQNQLVGDLLDVSAASAGKLRITSSPVNLTEVVALAIDGLRPAAEAKRIRLDASYELDDAIVHGDRNRLDQVFSNVLSNALKFTPKDGVIRVELRVVDADFEVTVEDTGIGMDPAFLPHAFEVFRQADASSTRQHGGLGIGLSIAKHIMELHGGTIEASSAGKKQGSTFRVRVPAHAAKPKTPDQAGIPATTSQSVAPERSPGRGVSVLVVDDEPDARDLLAYVLESRGFTVRVVASADEALAEVAREAPHLVISDIGMPDKDGYALIRSIRAHAVEEKRAIPAIALTAFGSNEDRRRALVAGFNLHIAKPVDPSALVKAVLELAGIGSPSPLGPSLSEGEE